MLCPAQEEKRNKKAGTVNKGGTNLVSQREDTNVIVLYYPVWPIKHFADISFYPKVLFLVSEKENQYVFLIHFLFIHEKTGGSLQRRHENTKHFRPPLPQAVFLLPSWIEGEHSRWWSEL